MKILLLFFSHLFLNVAFAQESYILINRENSDNIIKLMDSKRIRIKTFDGQKISGKFHILNDSIIKINGMEINLDQIQKIKPHPRVATILTDIVLVTAVATFSLVVGFVSIPAIGAVIGVSGISIIIAMSPNLLKNFNSKNNTFQIVVDSSEDSTSLP